MVGVAIGLAVAVFYGSVVTSAGIGIASAFVGSNAMNTPLSSALFSVLFAIAVGVGRSITACNLAMFSCVAPLSAQRGRTRIGVGRLLLWMSLGIILVTATYGLIGAILGSQIPTLSQGSIQVFDNHSYPLKYLQATIVFVILGAVLVFWGLTALQIVRNPFQKWSSTYPWLLPLFLGIITGCSTIGTPFPLFSKLFSYTSGTGNIALSVTTTALQGLANIAIVTLILMLLTYGTGGRFDRWLREDPVRTNAITGASMIAGGVFFLLFWGLRVPSTFGIGWFPKVF